MAVNWMDLPLTSVNTPAFRETLLASSAYSHGLTQPNVNAWAAGFAPQQGPLEWVAEHPFLTFAVGAVVVLMLMPRRGR